MLLHHDCDFEFQVLFLTETHTAYTQAKTKTYQILLEPSEWRTKYTIRGHTNKFKARVSDVKIIQCRNRNI